jgi:hypothetical protein
MRSVLSRLTTAWMALLRSAVSLKGMVDQV